MSEADRSVDGQDPAEGGQGTAQDPDHRDHPVDVDARRTARSGVVGHRTGGLAEPGVLEQQDDRHNPTDAG